MKKATNPVLQYFIVSSNFIGEAIEAVQTLRGSGIVASIEIKYRNFEKTVEFGKLSEIDYVLFINSSLKNRLTVYNIKSDSKTQITFQTFLKNIGGQIT